MIFSVCNVYICMYIYIFFLLTNCIIYLENALKLESYWLSTAYANFRVAHPPHISSTCNSTCSWCSCYKFTTATAYTGKSWASRAELWKGGFGKLFRDPGRKITWPATSVRRFLGVVRAFRRKNRECGKHFPSEADTDVTVFSGTRYAVSPVRESSNDTGNGKLVENFLNALAGTTYSDISIESLSRAARRTSSFPRLKFSIFVYGPFHSRPLTPSLFPPQFPIHNTFSSFPSHLRFRRSTLVKLSC